uniref:Caspase domain-containing protein n=1 Tax=Candidatus Kentrum sp. FW TaxID=2126338 RepID=A0A450TKF4_9GAMM|nr:MAG: Caspase domain-containing protein [Candidatus Kentron sp. FW]
MNIRHQLSVRLRRVTIPVMAIIAVLMGFGLVVQDAASASRGVVRVELKANEQPDAPGVGEVELYGSSHALVIGIDAYNAGWPRLSNAIKDAKLVAEALEGQGFSVTLKRNLDSRALKEAFERFFTFKGQDPQARLFVWFAGHGHTLDGEGFLVPADAPRPDSVAQFKYKALSLRRFGEFVRLARAKHALGVFDACFAGTVFTTQRSLPPPTITRHTALPVRQYVSSGDENQEVSDDGRFRKLFIRALEGEAPKADANGDGYLTGSELGMFLSDRVTNLTHARQTPRYGKLRDEDWDRGDFVFVTKPNTGASDGDYVGVRPSPPEVRPSPQPCMIKSQSYSVISAREKES